MTREQVEQTTRRAVASFIDTFDRLPDEREMQILVSAVVRFYAEPDALSHALH